MRAYALVAIAVIVAVSSAAEIPEQFLGTWVVGNSENFDEYLSAKDYGFFMRAIIKMAKLEKVLSKNPDGTYNYKILSSKKNVEWDNIKPNVEFQAEYLDDNQHKITIWYDENTKKLIEKHIVVGDPNNVDIYEYELKAPNKLAMYMEYKGVKCTRFYDKKQ